jgi:hypothetical protein
MFLVVLYKAGVNSVFNCSPLLEGIINPQENLSCCSFYNTEFINSSDNAAAFWIALEAFEICLLSSEIGTSVLRNVS